MMTLLINATLSDVKAYMPSLTEADITDLEFYFRVESDGYTAWLPSADLGYIIQKL